MRVKLKGEVLKNDAAQMYRRWGYQENCCPADVERAVESCPEGEELILEINSPGGSVYAGFEMYTALRQHKGHTAAEVYGIAGSAASVILAACDEVRMSPVANVMIHRSATYAEGNAEDMQETGQMLSTIDESILNAYMEKVGDKATRDQLRAYMAQETFFTAEGAVELGLADSILPRPEGKAEPNTAVACMRELALALQTPTLEELAELERSRLSAGQTKSEPPDNKATENSKKRQKEKRSETMEIKNVDELKARFPELTAQLCQEVEEKTTAQLDERVAQALAAERERLLGIDGVAMAGFEELIASAKADPEQNAGTVAMAIIKAQKEQGKSYLEGVKRDAKDCNAVPSEQPENKHEETAEEAAKVAVASFYGKKEEK